MNPYILIGFMLALFGAGAGGFRLGMDHVKATEADNRALVAEAVDAANAASAAVIADLKPKYTTIQGKLEKTIETNTVYRDCKLDPVGLQLANQALNAGADTGSGGKLPKADASAK